MTEQDSQPPGALGKLAGLAGRLALVLLSLAICEAGLRWATTRHGHVEYFLDREDLLLLPIGVPDLPSEAAQDAENEGKLMRYDPRLGWSLAPNAEEDGLGCTDAEGHRAHCDPARRPMESPGETVDLVTLGDSFTFGSEVSYEASWPAVLSRSTGLRVANLGVPAYGIDQAILRFEESDLAPRAVVLGVIADDLERARSQIFRLRYGGVFGKPLFLFEDGSDTPRVVNRPVLRGEALRRQFERGADGEFFHREPLFGHWLFSSSPLDVLYVVRVPRSLWVGAQQTPAPIYATPGPSLDDSIRILEYGREIVEARGARLLVVLLGDRSSFRLRASSGIPNSEAPWRPFESALQAAGFAYLQLADRFYARWADAPETVIRAEGVHYTEEANRWVAEALAETDTVRGLRTRDGR